MFLEYASIVEGRIVDLFDIVLVGTGTTVSKNLCAAVSVETFRIDEQPRGLLQPRAVKATYAPRGANTRQM